MQTLYCKITLFFCADRRAPCCWGFKANEKSPDRRCVLSGLGEVCEVNAHAGRGGASRLFLVEIAFCEHVVAEGLKF